jgi:hypothetical protein
MKLLFVGYGRAGKDEAAAYVAKRTGLRYAGSTSWAVLPYMAARLGLHPQVAWETRHTMRKQWYEMCNELRAPDATILARMVLQSGDITAGVRDIVEITAIKKAKLFDEIVWIERPGTPVDPTVTFTSEDCDRVLWNDGTLEEFRAKLLELCTDHWNLPIL